MGLVAVPRPRKHRYWRVMAVSSMLAGTNAAKGLGWASTDGVAAQVSVKGMHCTSCSTAVERALRYTSKLAESDHCTQTLRLSCYELSPPVLAERCLASLRQRWPFSTSQLRYAGAAQLSRIDHTEFHACDCGDCAVLRWCMTPVR